MIAVYYSPENLTKERYETITQKMMAAMEGGKLSAQPPLHHSCFGEDGHLMVFEIYESQQAFDALWPDLSAQIKEAGVTFSREPDVLPVVGLFQQAHGD